MNRNQKKKKDPFKITDFCLYQDSEDINLPDAKYGAAAIALAERGLFPIWALFVYKDLKKRANDAFPPELLAFSCDEAIMLAPECHSGECHGMLIALHSASGKILEMTSESNDKILLRFPEIKGEVVAIEGASLQILHYEASKSKEEQS